MAEFRKIHNLLTDRIFTSPAQFCRILLLLAFLPLTLQAYSSISTAKKLMEKGDSCRLVYKYNKALDYFLQASNDPEVSKDIDMQFQLMERIMRTHDVLRHWKEMPESSYRLYMLAKEKGDSVRISMALLMRGKRAFTLGHRKQGIQICLDALEMLKRTDYVHKAHELANYYGILAKMYSTDGQYDKAMSMSKEQERYVELSRKLHPEEWYHRNLLRVYIIRLEILAKLGRMAEADRIYQKYHPAITTDPLCGDALLTYFRLRGMNDEALQFLDVAMKNIREDGDSIGRNMQRLLDDMGDAYYGMGDYKKAAECYAGMATLADTLAIRSLNNLTVEVQKVVNSERTIAKHNERLTIIIAAVVLLLAIFLLLLRQAMIMRRRNRRMTGLIQQLMHYRELIIQNGDPVEMGENEASNASKEELRRFKEADKRIMKERLFTNPDFGRDDLMRLLGVDKNTLPSLLQNITGTNVSGYINIKRMEYAVFLIKEHPEYTLESIAEACGIKSSATFIRNFKAAYDMTPSEYRKQLGEAALTPPVLTFDNNSNTSGKLD